MNHANSARRLHFASQLLAVLLAGLTLLLAGAAATAADRGTAYPSAVETADGRILLVSGQGDARQIVRLDPTWLEARQASDDFSSPERLRGWTVTSDKQGQLAGVAVVAHPHQAARHVLRLQPSAGGHAAAQWNFPAGQQGKLTIRLQLPPGRSGATLSLTDHFSLPADRAAHQHAVFSIRLRADQRPKVDSDVDSDVHPDVDSDVDSDGLTEALQDGDIVLKPGAWQQFSIAWHADSMTAQLLVDNRPVGSPRRSRESAFGLNYLRLEATSDQDRSGGLLIESVAVDVSGTVDAGPEQPAGTPPQTVRSAPENESVVVRMPDDSLRIFYIARPDGKHLHSIASRDHGLTWSEPQVEFALPGAAYHAVKVLVDHQDRLHAVFHVLEQGRADEGYRGRLYNLWHCRQDSLDVPWTKPQQFFRGYVGALRGLVELPGGRLLVPFAFAVPQRAARPASGVDYGWHDVTVCLSDDGGANWRQSPARLKVAQDNARGLTRYGGVEPHVARLDDGRLWMLIRTKNGYLYESHSADDGPHWTDPQPTRFISSDSPVWVLRLSDGRRVLFLNSCQRYDDPRSYAIGGREVLHAAISDNRGLGWHGFREVLHER